MIETCIFTFRSDGQPEVAGGPYLRSKSGTWIDKTDFLRTPMEDIRD
jgi:hypothetical protein